MYRTCRAAGETVRKPVDRLIAAIAIQVQASVLHADSGFDALARHTRFSIARAR